MPEKIVWETTSWPPPPIWEAGAKEAVQASKRAVPGTRKPLRVGGVPAEREPLRVRCV